MATLGTAQGVAQAVAVAVASQDGEALAAALVCDLGNTTLIAQLASGRPDLKQLCASALERPYDEMLYEHFQFMLAASRGHRQMCRQSPSTHCRSSCRLVVTTPPG